jgi:Flp pilus assembly protein TadG
MFSVAFSRAQNFGKSERGVVLVLFLVLIVPLLFLIAVAIDFSQFLVMKRQIQGAADAAALAAATNPTMIDADALKLAQAMVAANYPAGSIGTVTSISISRPDTRSITVTGQATMNTTFLKLAGYSTLPVQVSSTASEKISHFDVYAAVDMSGSLGIAASTSDRALLQSLTQPYTKDYYEQNTGCQFACHQVEAGSVDLPQVWVNGKLVDQSVYDFVKAYNAQNPLKPVMLREDVLNAAFSDPTNGFVHAFFTSNPDASVIRRMDVLGFGGDPSMAADKQVIDLTNGPTDQESVASSALNNVPNQNKTETLFGTILPQLNTVVGTQGTGYTVDSPLKMVVLITDGVSSDRYSTITPIDKPFSGGSQTISPNDCGAIKDKKIVLAVIDVNYQNSAGDHWFDWWLGRTVSFIDPSIITTVYNEVSPALQQCASPGWYFSASDSNQIATALGQLLDQINRTNLRLVH